MLQALHHLHDHLLGSLQWLLVSLVVRSPEHDTTLQMWPHHCRVEAKEHLLPLAGDGFPNVLRVPLVFAVISCCRLLVSFVVHQDPCSLF